MCVTSIPSVPRCQTLFLSLRNAVFVMLTGAVLRRAVCSL